MTLSVPRTTALLRSCATCVVLLSTACAVEEIDASIADCGVTYCPSSTGGGDETTTGTSTGTTVDTSTADNAAAEAMSSASDAMGTDTGSSTTGPDLPVCGNGVVEGDEACDDGNATPADGCQECATDSVNCVKAINCCRVGLDWPSIVRKRQKSA